ncbi:ABC transporter permease [Glutamicibacter arilaitensis]|uniref:ABC transporter permease n=1 Tax=Glutamicibacter arilaitensis TaxID=256701 RepID=UPI003850C4B1
MLQVAIANIKTYARRYIAVLLAVAIGTAFLGATLAVDSSTRATLKNSLGDSYKNADLVASVDWELTPNDRDTSMLSMDTVREIRELPETSGVYGDGVMGASLRTSDNGYTAMLKPISADNKLSGMSMLEGRAPLGADEVVIDQEHAEQMGLSVSDTVAMSNMDDNAKMRELKIVGIVETTTDPMSSSFAQLAMQEDAWERFAGESAQLNMLVIDAKNDVAQTKAAVAEYFHDKSLADVVVNTADEQVLADVASLTGGTDQLTIILLVFALVALIVTGLVVMNTFSVVIAQRTRELALLRTLGAKRAQIRSSVLIEALLIGVIASVVGVALAVALMAGLIQLLRNLVPEMSYATLAVDARGIIIPLAVGIVMTVLAAWLPARRAMSLAPLAALRPFDAASVKNRAGIVRIIFGSLLALAGAALLAYGAVKGQLLIAFAGGLLSFPGILMLASLFVPATVFGIGKLLAGRSVAGRLASLNAVRNPGRTTATATALLIGVTLVSMIMVGGQSAKATLNGSISGEYPIDLTVAQESLTSDALAPKLAELEGIESVSAYTMRTVATEFPDGSSSEELAMVVDPESYTAVVYDEQIVPRDGELLSTWWQIEADHATVNGQPVKLRTTSASFVSNTLTESTAAKLGISEKEGMSGVAIKVDPSLSNGKVTELVESIADVAGVENSMISGGVTEKAMFSQIIDVLLMIVSGLLAVAVLIALIGVANTLSLSVLERTRENALLRALGLKKKQLRSMLATEAVLIGGVAALLGLILGAVYGLLGAHSALSSMGNMSYEIPWLQLAAVLLVSLLAALLASITPGRRAAKLSPVEGLATE